jgi:hypothetical protein
MISKFPGRCRGCSKPYDEGTDIYWTKEEGGWHWNCWENRKPGPESFRLADELSFLPHDEAMAADWTLLQLPASAGSPAAGRVESQARGKQSSLFRMSEQESG